MRKRDTPRPLMIGPGPSLSGAIAVFLEVFRDRPSRQPDSIKIRGSAHISQKLPAVLLDGDLTDGPWNGFGHSVRIIVVYFWTIANRMRDRIFLRTLSSWEKGSGRTP